MTISASARTTSNTKQRDETREGEESDWIVSATQCALGRYMRALGEDKYRSNIGTPPVWDFVCAAEMGAERVLGRLAARGGYLGGRINAGY